MSGFDDDIDRDFEQGSRAGLEAGAGLEVEDDTALDEDIEANAETPSWLQAGRRPEGIRGVEPSAAEELEPESETDRWQESAAPSWIEIDAEFSPDEEESGLYEELMALADNEASETDETEGTYKKPVKVHESKKTRTILIIVAAAAACVCVISTYMFWNDLGPFAPVIPSETHVDAEVVSEGEIESVAWATAGEDYKDLFALIEKQTSASLGSGDTPGPGTDDLMILRPDDLELSGGRIGDWQFDEALVSDVLKTDGNYIYSINNFDLFIAQVGPDDMDIVSRISQPAPADAQIYFEMFIAGDRLIAIRHGNNQGDAAGILYPFEGSVTDSSIDIFDISDRKAPKKLHTLSQSGSYVGSRMAGGYLYLISEHYGDVTKMDGEDPRTFVPLYSRDGEQFTPDESDIFLPPGSQWPCYTVISGIDATGSGDFVSNISVYGDIGMVYASQGAVYLARTAYEEVKQPAGVLEPLPGTDGPELEYVEYTNWSETLISKLTIDSGKVEPHAQAKVPGYLINQFSMDEWEGVLRLFTIVDFNNWFGFKNSRGTYTSDDWARLPSGQMLNSNTIYTLDSELIPLGKIEDIAPNERMYSCRFMGEFAYFTTLAQSSPLFAIDLRDAAAPRMAGELNVYNFSDNLRPFASGRLFGLGRNMDKDTGLSQGLKLAMYDNSDPADFRELHALIVDDVFLAAEQNYKAIVVSAEKELVAFPTFDRYLIYRYSDANGFEKAAELEFGGDDFEGTAIRGLFIGSYFYVISPNSIRVFAIDEGFEQGGDLLVNEGASSVNRWSFGGPVAETPADEPPPDLFLDDELV